MWLAVEDSGSTQNSGLAVVAALKICKKDGKVLHNMFSCSGGHGNFTLLWQIHMYLYFFLCAEDCVVIEVDEWTMGKWSNWVPSQDAPSMQLDSEHCPSIRGSESALKVWPCPFFHHVIFCQKSRNLVSWQSSYFGWLFPHLFHIADSMVFCPYRGKTLECWIFNQHYIEQQ